MCCFVSGQPSLVPCFVVSSVHTWPEARCSKLSSTLCHKWDMRSLDIGYNLQLLLMHVYKACGFVTCNTADLARPPQVRLGHKRRLVHPHQTPNPWISAYLMHLMHQTSRSPKSPQPLDKKVSQIFFCYRVDTSQPQPTPAAPRPPHRALCGVPGRAGGGWRWRGLSTPWARKKTPEEEHVVVVHGLVQIACGMPRCRDGGLVGMLQP